MPCQKSIDGIGQATRGLRHEPGIRVGGRARHVHPSALEIEHEQCVVRDQPPRGPDLAGEEVGPRNLPPVGPEKRPPGGGPVRGRWDPVGLEHLGDRTPGHDMAQVLERPLDARVAPPRILSGDPQNEGRDLAHDPRTAWPLRREGPLPSDRLPVPSQDRVLGHDGRDLPQAPSAESATLRREASALVIGQPEAAPLHLLLEDAVLLDQVLDDLLLVAVDPSRQGDEQHLQGVEVGNHSPILPCRTTHRRGVYSSAE